MIRHIVLVRFKPDTTEAQISGILQGLATLTALLSGARNFVGGRSTSPENLERGYHHGFTMDFDTWSDLALYADHPGHKALGADIVSHAEGGLDGVLVLDVEVAG